MPGMKAVLAFMLLVHGATAQVIITPTPAATTPTPAAAATPTPTPSAPSTPTAAPTAAQLPAAATAPAPAAAATTPAAATPAVTAPATPAPATPAPATPAIAAAAAAAPVQALPAVPPYPALLPVDTGFPANIPPAYLALQSAPGAPPFLVSGTNSCPAGTTVADVLTANNRAAFLALLQQAPLGPQILSGSMEVTVLAPTDAQVAALGITPSMVAGDALLVPTYAHYHVMQGIINAQRLRISAGFGFNTSLMEADCPTAYQTISPFTVPGSPTLYVRSGTTTAAVTAADIPACNAIVHLVDTALKPCCTSLYELLPQFSVVQITPTYFDNYQPPPPLQNLDSFNRRIFEEQMLDMLLFMTQYNSTATILWPTQAAWDSFQLQPLLPSIPIANVTMRQRALKIVVLYMQSYQMMLLPQDTAAGAAAAGAAVPFVPALRNATSTQLWNCSDVLSVGTSGLVPTTSPVPASPAAAPVPAPATTSSPAVVVTPAAAPSPVATPSPAVVPSPAAVASPAVITRITRELAPGATAGFARSLLQFGNGKTTNVVGSYDTCEGQRILLVDTVVVPCDFIVLVNSAAVVDAQLSAFAATSDADMYYTNLKFAQDAGLINLGNGTSITDPTRPGGGASSAAASAQHSALTAVMLAVAAGVLLWQSV